MTDEWSKLARAAGKGSFKPVPFYDAETDTLTLFISDAESTRERIDPYLTVYRSIRTNAVVGCHIKQVKKTLLKRVQSLRLGIETADLTLSLLLYVMPHAGAEGAGTRRPVESRRYAEVAKPLARIASKVRLPELVSRG